MVETFAHLHSAITIVSIGEWDSNPPNVILNVVPPAFAKAVNLYANLGDKEKRNNRGPAHARRALC